MKYLLALLLASTVIIYPCPPKRASAERRMSLDTQIFCLEVIRRTINLTDQQVKDLDNDPHYCCGSRDAVIHDRPREEKYYAKYISEFNLQVVKTKHNASVYRVGNERIEDLSGNIDDKLALRRAHLRRLSEAENKKKNKCVIL